MKITEAKKEISQLRQERQNAIDDARIVYLEGFIDGCKEEQAKNQLKLADAQLLGFTYGKTDDDIIRLVRDMGFTEQEWKEWKRDCSNCLKESDFECIDEWFTNKAQHCSECGKPMEKKEMIIKGDIDTCDECLCPE